LPLQILWINLITDSLPALALVFEKPENVMKTKPRKEKSILSGIWLFIIVGGILTFLAKFSIFLLANSYLDLPLAQTRTMVLTTAILFELLFVYTCRSKIPLLKTGIFSNKWLNYAVLFSVLIHLVLVYTALGGLFSVVPLSLNNWLFILPFAFAGLIIFEIAKYIRTKDGDILEADD
jgi:Ca2+-transporting ATPase